MNLLTSIHQSSCLPPPQRSAPSSLTFTSRTTTSITLSFTPVVGAVSYTLNAVPTSGSGTVSANTSTTTYTLDGLWPNKTYNISVIAIFATGPPSPPTYLSVSTLSGPFPWAKTSNPIIAWVVNGQQIFAIPAYALNSTGDWQYSVNGASWTNFPYRNYSAISEGITHGGVTYTGYVMSSPWNAYATTYQIRIARGSIYQIGVVAALDNRAFTGVS